MHYAGIDIEDLFFQSFDKKPIVITRLDLQNDFAYCLDENRIGGKFALQLANGNELKAGDNCKVYLTKHPFKNYQIIKKIELSETEHDWLKPFDGNLSIKASGIGFVDNVYISEKIILKNELTNNQKLAGVAIRSYDSKKNKEGWSGLIVIT